MSSGYSDIVKHLIRQASRTIHEEAMTIRLCTFYITIKLERVPPLVHLYSLGPAPAWPDHETDTRMTWKRSTSHGFHHDLTISTVFSSTECVQLNLLPSVIQTEEFISPPVCQHSRMSWVSVSNPP